MSDIWRTSISLLAELAFCLKSCKIQDENGLHPTLRTAAHGLIYKNSSWPRSGQCRGNFRLIRSRQQRRSNGQASAQHILLSLSGHLRFAGCAAMLRGRSSMKGASCYVAGNKAGLGTVAEESAAEKPLTKITINDIADDCGINRMTFYYHSRIFMILWNGLALKTPKSTE